MIYPNFTCVYDDLKHQLLTWGQEVHTHKWQGVEIKDKPELEMTELIDQHFKVPLTTESLEHWRQDTKANMPWADDHFEERVCGKPINPGIEWANWPYGKSAERFLDNNGQFNHNYMERFWPKQGISRKATRLPEDFNFITMPQTQPGMRCRYGDLQDVVNLLLEQPDTRQAFFPVWFPEDTGVLHGGRVPCTIGYQFLMRNSHLHMVYYIRSCDFVRHFRDDCYLAIRLLLWVLGKLRENDGNWHSVKPGFYSMHIMNLHIFKNDFLEERNANK